ncbi:MAG: SMC-Scp complex subunit ScpB [Alphaproteobacteria bacterium]|nr:SMC-Scp complex subunit ScpB [Alphaproteobacteria bacterium]
MSETDTNTDTANANEVNVAEADVVDANAAEKTTGAKKKPRRVKKIAKDRDDSLALLEAALFASPEPLNARELAPYIADGENIDSLMRELAQKYTAGGVRLEESGRAWSFRTAPEYGERLMVVRERRRRISRAAAETLAVIAYHQPVTRGQIEEIRGVVISSGTLDILLEAGWVAPQGRADRPGHPLLWGTTAAFLDQFNLKNLEDLPAEQELRASGLLDGRAALAIVSERAEAEKTDAENALAAEEGDEDEGEESAETAAVVASLNESINKREETDDTAAVTGNEDDTFIVNNDGAVNVNVNVDNDDNNDDNAAAVTVSASLNEEKVGAVTETPDTNDAADTDEQNDNEELAKTLARALLRGKHPDK